MPTAAKVSFDENWSTITDIQSLIGPDGTTSHSQSAARNRAALIFCITAWESYIEDLVREATDYIAEHCASFGELPKRVQKALVTAVTPQKGAGTPSGSGRYPQELADDGWRLLLRELAAEATEGSNFNTPKSANVSDLFTKWCGIDVTQHWYWQNFPLPGPAERLDESISLRGAIVHTGKKPSGINKNWISTYGEKNIRKLVDRTDENIIHHVNGICGNNRSEPFAFG